ncbi:MAG: DUF3458 domain-containing protein, partial [Pseudomonadota bacterium]
HDGQAVECDDFRAAMADANQRDLGQFERWYSQAGTPVVTAATHYDSGASTFSITLSQHCPATPGQDKKLPFHIPVAVGLLGADGRDLVPTRVLELRKEKETFIFEGVKETPTPSILRDFSAPVVLDYPYTDAELLHLFSHDSDAVNRWEAGQRLAMGRLLTLTDAVAGGAPLALDDTFVEAWRKTLCDDTLDPAFREQALMLPSETMIAEQVRAVDPQAIHVARQFMRATIGTRLRRELLAQIDANATPGPYSPDALSAGRRGLKNLALSFLAAAIDAAGLERAQVQFDHAGNMTDRVAALAALIHADAPGAGKALAHFYQDFEHEALVIDKWFAMQGASPATDVASVRALMAHPAFNVKNPNRARSLIFTYCVGNPAQFHARDGSGYAFWAEQVIALNALNPQVAARLARSLDRWRRYVPALQAQMKRALEQVAAQDKLSNDVREVVSKALSN